MSVSVTLGATIATVPLCAWYFGVVSLAAVVTNLLVLWAVSLIFYGLMAVCVLGLFWTAGASFWGKAVSLLIRYVLTTSRIVADFPLSAVYTRSVYIVIWLILVYALLFAFLWSKNRKPMTLVCCASLGLCIALLTSWAEPMADDVRFTVLDVGQGQCLLLQTDGRNYMVDCGGNSDEMAADAAAETLLSQGISYLDGLILTHYDRDHAGGAENLLSRIDVELLILPPVYSDLSLPAKQTLYAREDLLLDAGDTQIRIFASRLPGNDNENSLCVLFDTQNCDILITGDRDGFGERSLLRNADIPDVDVLIAGHHGSKNATCEELLTGVRPEIVCISAGRDNLFGHPAPELLQRLQSYGCTVYRTDLHGTITIRR
jgi:competence protein ComEC